MKKLFLFSTAVALLGAIACSSNKKVGTPDVVAATADTDTTVIAQKEREIDTLQSRLDSIRDKTHQTKLQGSLNDNRAVVNHQYAELSKAKADLQELKTLTDRDAFDSKQAELDNRLASIRSELSTHFAE